MMKYRYIKSQLAKTNKKNDENYVVTRIWNKLDSLDIKFITQQYVARENGKYALTDMYFPQVDLHVEIDERHHKAQIEYDQIREQDIISITGHEIYRIDVSGTIEEVNQSIDEVVEKIKGKISLLGDAFIPWEVEKEYEPETYIQKGFVDLFDNVSFRTSADVANVFGHNYKGFQRGGTRHPYRDDVMIWFPKLYPNGEWNNSISFDGTVIRESNLHDDKRENHVNEVINNQKHKRIVFAKVRGPLGYVMYKFKGEFELDIIKSKEENCLVWIRISDRVSTFPLKSIEEAE